jgi:hypothetical protein
MDEFDRSRNCPKCGSSKPSENVYHPESIEFEHGCADGEHMHRKCVKRPPANQASPVKWYLATGVEGAKRMCR